MAEKDIRDLKHKPKERNQNGSSFVVAEVTNCTRLNVRKSPDPKAEVIEVISSKEVFKADVSGDSEFVKVKLRSGKRGYAMRKYIRT